jgi:ABC-type lipoprotein release transport system permease subunit
MMIFGLILKEICHRKVNFLLSVLAVVTAAALFISFFTAAKTSERETARLMLTMGFNVHIVSKDTNINEFLLTGLSDRTMPQEYLDKLATQKAVSYNHLLASLQKKISWRGVEVIVTGLAPEICPPGGLSTSLGMVSLSNHKKSPISYQIEPGNLFVGYRVAQALGLKESNTVEIEGKPLKVAKCLAESGNTDDIRVQCHLRDAQDILKMPGQISEIQAVDCLCFAPAGDPVSVLRKEIGSLLPDTQVFHTRTIASARTRTRQMVRDFFAVIMPLIVIACGLSVGVLAAINVRDRQQEIGILRALGYRSGQITTLFLGKAVVIGAIGATVGFLTGTFLTMKFGPDVFKMTAQAVIKPEPILFVIVLIFAPLFAAVSSFIPAMIAVTYDPAVTLREE